MFLGRDALTTVHNHNMLLLSWSTLLFEQVHCGLATQRLPRYRNKWYWNGGTERRDVVLIRPRSSKEYKKALLEGTRMAK